MNSPRRQSPHHYHHGSLCLVLGEGCLAKEGTMTTCAPLSTIVLLIVSSSSFLRPPAAQEREGAVLVLTSPLVTLTSHYQIQLVPGPAPLLKKRVSLSPNILCPHLSSPCSLLLASPASIQPCSRLTCVHHGDKAERENERECVPLLIIFTLTLLLSLATSLFLPPSPGSAQTLARWEPR